MILFLFSIQNYTLWPLWYDIAAAQKDVYNTPYFFATVESITFVSWGQNHRLFVSLVKCKCNCECFGWWKQRYLCDCEYGACTGNSLRVVLGNITFYNWQTWRIAEYCNFSELVILCNKKHQIPWRDVLSFWRFQMCFYVSAVKNIPATQGWNEKDMLRLCHTSQPWDRCIKYR